MANIIPSQKISRTAFDLFIFFTPFLRASVRDFLHRDQTAADAPRFNTRNIAQELPRKASKSFAQRATEPAIFTRKGNRIVTKAVWVPSAARTNHHSNGAELPSSARENFWSSCRTSLWEKTRRLFSLTADFFQ
jgi:hypothetical protein